MPTAAERARHRESLERALAADLVRGCSVTAQLAERIGATAKESSVVGQHGRLTIEQMARACGFHDSAPGDLGAVIEVDGRAYR